MHLYFFTLPLNVSLQNTLGGDGTLHSNNSFKCDWWYLVNRKMRDELCWIGRSHSFCYLHAASQSLPGLICIHPPLITLRETNTRAWHIIQHT